MAKAFSVTQVNRYIKRLMESDSLLGRLEVEGELSNVKKHGAGHLYFSLKDSGATISCVMFSSYGAGISFEPKNGEMVLVSGNVSLYEKTGQYQLYAVNMKPVGEGSLERAFSELKDKLNAEGLFDEARKKEIPIWVDCIALVTSPQGAAVQDMIKVIKERNPCVKIMICPVLVQGNSAAVEIAQAIKALNRRQDIDIMIVGRGGGSAEDLQAFNEEIVARAIADSDIPVITGIGHEIDFSIADFAADLRAPTPSAAAAAAVPDIFDLVSRIEDYKKRAERAINHKLQMRRMHVHQLTKQLDDSINTEILKNKNKLENQAKLLEKISPFALWERGYAALCAKDGSVIRSVADVAPNVSINIFLKDGEIAAKVEKIKESLNG